MGEIDEQISGAVDYLTRLALVARGLTTAPSASDVIDMVVRQGMAGLGAEGAVLAAVTADGAVVPVETVGYSKEAVVEFAPMHVGQELPLTIAVRDREPIWVPSRADAASRFPDMLDRTRSGSQAWAAIPLIADGAVIGVLGVSFLAPRDFSETERLFIGALGDQCALALAADRNQPAPHDVGTDDSSPSSGPWQQAARALSSAMFTHSRDAVMFTSPDGQVLAANPVACRMLELSEGEIRRRGRSGLADPSDTRWATALQARESAGRFSGELRMIRGDGSAFTAEIDSAVFENEIGEPRTVVIFHDITDQ
jgi:PAS domain S-box-containing protein